MQVGWDHSILSPAKAGSESLGDVIPGLRSLRSLTRGYILSPTARLVAANIHLDARRS
jgi:hypothetical protein